jgi:Ni/Co efflux regulator RcnB
LAQDHQQEHGNQQSNDRRDQGQANYRNQGQANHRNEGQANYRNQGSTSYHFRQEDAPRLRQQYSQMDRVDRDRRPHYSAGQHLPAGWNQRIRPVPTSVYRQLPPPPPGYRLGYLDGYAVAYNPTTQIIADVLDLVATASGR